MLVLPDWDPAGRRVEIEEGVVLLLSPPEAMPADARAWAVRTLEAGVAPGLVLEMIHADETETSQGWPVALVVSDLVHAESGAVVARRLHAFYRFYVDAAIAILEIRDRARDVLVEEARAALLGARAPYGRLGIRSLTDLWAGFDPKGEVTE